MPRLAQYDRTELERVLRKQRRLIQRQQALGCSMSAKAISYRTRTAGTWQIVLPGVYLRGGGNLAPDQRVIAALLYAGAAIGVTGPAALAFYGIPAKRSEFVDVLVPLSNRRKDAGFARLRRTVVEPSVIYADGVTRYVRAGRAICDTARQLTEISDVRAVVAAGVQGRHVELWELTQELDLGPMRGSALLRRALAEVSAGARSAAEADLLTMIRQSTLPEPQYNPRLFVGKDFLASPDAWWPDFGVAVEVDSRAWHLSPGDWERTLARHARMTAEGILVLHFPPARLRKDRRAVVSEVRSSLDRSRGPLPHIRMVPSALVAWP
jgi:very-short-patch-repair endonuclease